MKTLDESGLIDKIRRQSAEPPHGSRSRPVRRAAGSLVLGIGDDCAILQPPRGHQVVVTTDFSLEGRHFRRDWHPAQSVGHRTLARGLSDLAAMGARPLAAFLSLALPPQMLATPSGRLWVDRFFTGLHALAQQHGVPLAGGDTSESPCNLVLADIVLTGSVPAGRALRRSGARAGDALYVTGALGGAAAELEHLARRSATKGPTIPLMPRASTFANHPQLLPQPRLQAGLALVSRKLATAAIDLSDGLSTDLRHLCRESGVGAEIFEDTLPIHPLARNQGRSTALQFALNGGEDYELLFSAAPSVRIPRMIAGIPITRIGILTREKSIWIKEPSGRGTRLKPAGWQHFSQQKTDDEKKL